MRFVCRGIVLQKQSTFEQLSKCPLDNCFSQNSHKRRIVISKYYSTFIQKINHDHPLMTPKNWINNQSSAILNMKCFNSAPRVSAFHRMLLCFWVVEMLFKPSVDRTRSFYLSTLHAKSQTFGNLFCRYFSVVQIEVNYMIVAIISNI